MFIFFVVCISATVAYFATMQSRAKQADVVSSSLQNKKNVQREVAVVSSDGENNAATLKPEEVIVPAAKAEIVQSQIVTVEQPTKTPVPEIERNKNPATRLEEAKLYAEPKILTGKYIDISLKFQNMVIFEDGKALDAYQISSGKRGLETPIGTFKIENKSPRAWSAAYGLWMPNWMAILPTGKVGIHELPIWPGGYQEGANHLGTPVSHGCVRLGKGPAKRVYDWAEIGTPVVVHL